MSTQQITINKDELPILIKEAVREILHKEAINFSLKRIERWE
ncbi:MAG: hypothetical protein V1749_00935 [Candidatus Desantisbacteria bacterium]